MNLQSGRCAMLYTPVSTSLSVTLFLAQQTSQQLGRITMLYTPVFIRFNITLFVAQQTTQQLCRITMLFKPIFTILIVPSIKHNKQVCS